MRAYCRMTAFHQFRHVKRLNVHNVLELSQLSTLLRADRKSASMVASASTTLRMSCVRLSIKGVGSMIPHLYVLAQILLDLRQQQVALVKRICRSSFVLSQTRRMRGLVPDEIDQSMKSAIISADMRPVQLGQFVTSSECRLGIGTLIDMEGNVARIAYFDSPAAQSVVKDVSRASVQSVVLDSQVRVYWKDEDTQSWMAGRVLGYFKDEHAYWVRFPNEVCHKLHESRLQTRCNKLLEDPTDHLALRLNETAYWHVGRADFLKSVFDQRRACGGMTALLSSAIDLETHQIAVVRRVLQDSVQRYLLADEVGLGKTIEAGLLIRQFVLDDPQGHRVLVIVPEALLEQWRQELRTRFFLDDWLGKTIQIVPSQALDRIAWAGRDARLIVIDEAHHLAAGARSGDPQQAALFDAVAEISRPLDRKLLLLSATPALHNERGFLAMLHLLDPAMYSLDDLPAFQERVRQRQRVAEALSALQPDEPNYFMKPAVEDIAGLAPQDVRLVELAGRLLARLEDDPAEDDPERLQLIAHLRSHISETWRLHRRILRTRRTKDSQVLLPGRTGAVATNWTCSDLVKLEEALNEWRFAAAQAVADGASAESWQRLARVFTEAAVCDPSVIGILSVGRIGKSSRPQEAAAFSRLALFPNEAQCLQTVPLFDGERELLQRLAHIAEAVDVTKYMEELRSAIDPYMQLHPDQAVSVIVFANYPATADDLFEMLKKRFDSSRVFRHSSTSNRWTQALGGKASQILVCDRRAEEGLNLQSRRSVIVHADLPLSANRIEQRMGRADRIGAGQGIRSIVMVAQQSTLQRSWFECLDQALKVFDRSVASLQYVIEEEFSRVWTEYLECGAEAVQDAVTRLCGTEGIVEKELRKIRSQSELDSIDFDPTADVKFCETLLLRDLKSKHLRDVADAWIKDRLHFKSRGEEDTTDGVLRYQFCRRDDLKGRSSFQDTLMPLKDFERVFVRSIERPQDAPAEILYETVPITFDRQLAQKRFARLARVGDPLIDAFAYGLRTDDRGISFAMWRYRPDLKELDDPAELAFRFDFVIEADRTPALEVLELQQGATKSAIRRRLDEIFKPLPATVWLNSNMQMIRDPERLNLLTQPYNDDWHYIESRRVRDFNLNQKRWPIVSQWWDSQFWIDLCRKARTAAEQALRDASELQVVCERTALHCEQQLARRIESLESRRVLSSGTVADRLRTEIDFEQALSSAMQAGIRQPSTRLDSIGAIFLSQQNPFANMEAEDARPKASRFDE